MDLDTAKQKFLDLVGGIHASNMKEFFAWINESFSFDKKDESSEGDLTLLQIIDDLKQCVPLNAVLPSEKCVLPDQDADLACNLNTTTHVDSFLYDDDDVDELCEQGKLSRSYCLQCGSHSTAPLTFISHSLSLPELKYIFRFLLPCLAGKTLVDVGSRLGGVLYAAYFFSAAGRIFGIEMNADFCKTQLAIIEKYEMKGKVAVICDDMRKHQELLASADVIVLNNVFQFFLLPPDQTQCWQILRSSIKSGAVVVTVPSLVELTANLPLGFAITDWVTEVPTECSLQRFALESNVSIDDFANIHMYQVK